MTRIPIAMTSIQGQLVDKQRRSIMPGLMMHLLPGIKLQVIAGLGPTFVHDSRPRGETLTTRRQTTTCRRTGMRTRIWMNVR